MQWHTQEVNVTANMKVKLNFTLTELRATKHLMWNCHVYDSAKVSYYMILGRDILT